jgi:hypothetical protein
MRKETSAAFIAGALSGLVVGLAFVAVFLTLILWIYPLKYYGRNPATVSREEIIFAAVFMGSLFTGFITLLGAIAGTIFVRATNKLPIRSTYIKALIPVPIVWALFRLWLLFFNNWASLALSYLFVESLEGAGIIALGVVLFAYLFNRWSN